ncbi:hypothetical protein ACFY5D_08590 [Paeniglutamicibacter sp. NPDC012692]|uniref:hypothetical protein n=1 Tax=Paeniglutamicibacter sp. NPDC012692 TaxID=3364388 RepID=UPI0036786C07
MLATFLLIIFLGAAGAYAIAHGKAALSTALLASAAALLLGVVSAFRRPTRDSPVETAAVETSTGQRAATWFPIFRSSAILAAVVVGLSVVVLVASIALSARLMFLHDYSPLFLIVLLGIALIGCGVFLMFRGLRMARIAATAQNPGVYLTRSRIVLYGSRGMHEIYWNDVSSVEAADPPQRQPLGKRGPAWILVTCTEESKEGSPLAGPSKGPSGLRIQVHELAANPDALLRTLAHYLQHPAERAELGTDSALATVSGLGPDTQRQSPAV